MLISKPKHFPSSQGNISFNNQNNIGSGLMAFYK